ncbi:MAG: carboxypeptidase regulatory-like domain-containing protein, partial [Planctomycetes bacterium]|nr:carboxypeptidase regulatory-like domain-containing protein [Planctomycetota bacterium]
AEDERALVATNAPSKRESVAASSAAASSLSSGETQELPIELDDRADILCYGRVVAAEDGSPIAGARIRPRRSLAGEPSELVTDAAGGFVLRSSRRFDSQRFTVDAAGRAERTARAEEGHSLPEHALVVHLSRAAALRLVLRAPSGDSVEGACATVSTSRFGLMEPQEFDFSPRSADLFAPDPSWTAFADSDGRCEFPELAPGVPLDVEVTRDDRTVLRRRGVATLAPGETRELELSFDSGATLAGVVHDAEGRPVGGVELWLIQSEHDRQVYFRTYDEPDATAVADAGGRFRFEGVAAGKWKLGPAAVASEEPLDESALAPAPMPVEVQSDANVVDVTLVVYRGLFIRGSVLDDQGVRVPNVDIRATALPTAYLAAASDDAGEFVFGPLSPGEFELRAGAHHDEHAPGDGVTARAGDRDVVLRVVPGATLFGSVVDAEGATHEATLSVRRVDVDALSRGSSMHQIDGEFRLNGLNAGDYVVVARSGVLVGAVTAAAVAREPRGPLRIELQQGASLELVWKGADPSARYALSSRGVVLASGWTIKGEAAFDIVPTGTISIEFETTTTKQRGTATVVLTAGERRTLALGGPE